MSRWAWTVKSHIATLGLYNAKAANVVALSQLLIERHDGGVPAATR